MKKKYKSVTINKQTFPVEYLTKPEDIKKGMMWRTNLNGCMVFDVGLGYHSFWMKNCLLNLDIVFVLNGKIKKIYLNCPKESSEKKIPTYDGIGEYVIEFPSGTSSNWKIGDKVLFNL